MPAYLVAEITVTDRPTFDQYRQAVPAVIAAHGGRYLVRGPDRHLLEGGPSPSSRLVILEFPDMDRLRAFWSSADYAPLRALRERSSTSRIEAFEGYIPL